MKHIKYHIFSDVRIINMNFGVLPFGFPWWLSMI